MDLVQQEWDGEKYVEPERVGGFVAVPMGVDPIAPPPSPVLAVQRWAMRNDHLIAEVARLGYIQGPVLDATYGRGNFWKKYRPVALATNDISAESTSDFHYDFRSMPDVWAGRFATVVFDPPYRFTGTVDKYVHSKNADWGVVHNRYGLQTMGTAERMDLIYDGLTECTRVCAPTGRVLVKCQAQVVSGGVVWQDDLITRKAEDELGLTKEDRFDLPRTPMQQHRTQKHARRNHSTLLVFRKGR